jgi:hypothetical protein
LKRKAKYLTQGIAGVYNKREFAILKTHIMNCRYSLLLLVLLSLNFAGFSQSTKEIFEHSWSGSSVQEGGTLTKDGKIYLSQKFRFKISDDNSVTGTNTTTFTLDGTSYSRTVVLKGTYYPSRNEIFAEEDYEKSIDKLPYDLFWCPGRLTLKLYSNANKPGKYILKGISRSYGQGCSGIENNVEVVD